MYTLITFKTDQLELIIIISTPRFWNIPETDMVKARGCLLLCYYNDINKLQLKGCLEKKAPSDFW